MFVSFFCVGLNPEVEEGEAVWRVAPGDEKLEKRIWNSDHPVSGTSRFEVLTHWRLQFISVSNALSLF